MEPNPWERARANQARNGAEGASLPLRDEMKPSQLSSSNDCPLASWPGPQTKGRHTMSSGRAEGAPAAVRTIHTMSRRIATKKEISACERLGWADPVEHLPNASSLSVTVCARAGKAGPTARKRETGNGKTGDVTTDNLGSSDESVACRSREAIPRCGRSKCAGRLASVAPGSACAGPCLQVGWLAAGTGWHPGIDGMDWIPR